MSEEWVKANTCPRCEMVITNRWKNHKINGECDKELEKREVRDGR